MKKSNKLVNVWDVEYSELAETLSFKVVCDQEVGELLTAIARKDTLTKEQMALQLAELLERSIHLNLPRSHRFWNRNREN
tara:strand:+ start:1637 stop:1876 length:240 start_codon:yes stop_codon:yes gene_type:complete